MRIMLRDINERKALIRTILPQLHIIRVPSGPKSRLGALSWNDYFQTHPEEAQALGYGIDQKMWNANNVVGRYLMKTEGIQIGTNGNAPPKVEVSGLLQGIGQRRQLLLEIFPQLQEGKSGQKSWKGWFEGHPEHATALGYDVVKTRPKVWASNLRMTQHASFKRDAAGGSALVPYKVETINPDEAARQLASKLQRMQEENKLLGEQLRESERKLTECRSTLNAAKEITFDLLLQLRELRS